MPREETLTDKQRNASRGGLVLKKNRSLLGGEEHSSQMEEIHKQCGSQTFSMLVDNSIQILEDCETHR